MVAKVGEASGQESGREPGRASGAETGKNTARKKSAKKAVRKAAKKSVQKAGRKAEKTTGKAKVKTRAASAARRRKESTPPRDRAGTGEKPESNFFGLRLNDLVDGLSGELTNTARRWATEVGMAQFRLGKALLTRKPTDPALAKQAGVYLRELREVAGLTRDELSDAVQLADVSLLKAVESGASTLSFELILRLAAVLARHDPIPFVVRLTRTFNPEVAKFLESWGVGRLQLQYEREREFINIFRRRDAARKLSDEGFARVLDFTRAAFEMSLHFVAEQEHQEDHEVEID